MQASQKQRGSSQVTGTRRTVEAVKKEVKRELALRPRSIAGSVDMTKKSINQAAQIASAEMIQTGDRRKKLAEKNRRQSRERLFLPLKPRMADWLDLLARPFSQETFRCPISFNPMPTPFSMVARSTWVHKQVVPAGSNFQVVIYPGHTTPVDLDEMDGPSYHSNWQIIGNPAVTLPIGPVSYLDAGSTLRNGAIGVLSVYASGNLGPGSVITDTSTNASLPIYPDVFLPITGKSKDGAHTRHRLLASGIKFGNETIESNRGGSFFTVQPVTASLPSSSSMSGSAGNSIKDWAKYPTFYDHGLCDEKMGSISWIPRTQDLSFWHPGLSTSAAIGVQNAAYFVWYVNNTSAPQTISISSVHHWEIGGENVMTLCEPTVQIPSDQNVVTPTLTILQDSHHTATPAPRVAEVVATASAPHALPAPATDDFVSRVVRNHVTPALVNIGSSALLSRLEQLMKQ